MPNIAFAGSNTVVGYNVVVAVNPAGSGLPLASTTLMLNTVTVPVVVYEDAVAAPPYAATGLKLTLCPPVTVVEGIKVDATTGGPPETALESPATIGVFVYLVQEFFPVTALNVNCTGPPFWLTHISPNFQFDNAELGCELGYGLKNIAMAYYLLSSIDR